MYIVLLLVSTHVVGTSSFFFFYKHFFKQFLYRRWPVRWLTIVARVGCNVVPCKARPGDGGRRSRGPRTAGRPPPSSRGVREFHLGHGTATMMPVWHPRANETPANRSARQPARPCPCGGGEDIPVAPHNIIAYDVARHGDACARGAAYWKLARACVRVLLYHVCTRVLARTVVCDQWSAARCSDYIVSGVRMICVCTVQFVCARADIILFLRPTKRVASV